MNDLYSAVYFQSNHDERAVRILQQLHPTINTTTFEGITGLSEADAGRWLFMSLKNIMHFVRDPTKTREHVDELILWVETYYQVTILLFNRSKAFTPYKVKLTVMIRILQEGTIHALYDHLSEGTENSNHGAQFTYQNHTMRDGGYEQFYL